jgi:outer membrane immunogenic protein
MSRLLRTCVASAALAYLSTTIPAFSADMPVKAPAPGVQVAAPLSWSGCYAGLHGGYGWADAKDLTPTNTPRNLDPDGYFAGGQVGCNWQWQPQWVFGVEADIAGANISQTKSFTGGGQPTIEEKIDRLASVRARAGFLAGLNNLFYVTGGWGWADTSRHVRLAGLGGNPFQTQSETYDGWVVGAGLEHMISQNWTLKVEYLYYDLGSGTYNFTIGTGPNKVDLSLHTVKFGANYKF